MKQFQTNEIYNTGILYLELASSICSLLLLFGLIISMMNVLIKDSVLSDNRFLQRI